MADFGAEDRTRMTPDLFGPCPSPPAQVTTARIPSQHIMAADLDSEARTSFAVGIHVWAVRRGCQQT